MKTLYLDCGMGAAGDMLAAALLELMPEPDEFIDRLNSLGIPDVAIKREERVKCGIVGTHFSVKVRGVEETGELYEHEHEHHHSHEHEHDHEHEQHHGHCHDHDHNHSHDHSHSSMSHIQHIIEDHISSLPATVVRDILNVYSIIADAESQVHGTQVSEIHFHEVGTMDAIADITAVCLLMNELAPDEVVVSPIHVGSGHTRCAHGILPVPAPATACILQGIPIYGGSIKGELCTPTGAALLKYFATRFDDMPVMAVQAIGYGMGNRDYQTANCVRAMLGTSSDLTDTVAELSCNVDDMTAEEIGFAMERLMEEGAADVYTVPIGMKKSRPGTMLCTICTCENKDNIIKALYKYTSTIGIREQLMKRYVLDRTVVSVDTPYGPVGVKESIGYGARRRKFEYEDIARIAREQGMSLSEVKALIKAIQ